MADTTTHVQARKRNEGMDGLLSAGKDINGNRLREIQRKHWWEFRIYLQLD